MGAVQADQGPGGVTSRGLPYPLPVHDRALDDALQPGGEGGPVFFPERRKRSADAQADVLQQVLALAGEAPHAEVLSHCGDEEGLVGIEHPRRHGAFVARALREQSSRGEARLHSGSNQVSKRDPRPGMLSVRPSRNNGVFGRIAFFPAIPECYITGI